MLGCAKRERRNIVCVDVSAMRIPTRVSLEIWCPTRKPFVLHAAEWGFNAAESPSSSFQSSAIVDGAPIATSHPTSHITIPSASVVVVRRKTFECSESRFSVHFARADLYGTVQPGHSRRPAGMEHGCRT